MAATDSALRPRKATTTVYRHGASHVQSGGCAPYVTHRPIAHTMTTHAKYTATCQRRRVIAPSYRWEVLNG